MLHTHVVDCLRFELAFASEADALDQHERVGQFARAVAVPVIAECLDGFDSGDAVVRLDRLEVEVGDLPLDETDAAWSDRLRQALDRALGRAVAEAGAAPAPTRRTVGRVEPMSGLLADGSPEIWAGPLAGGGLGPHAGDLGPHAGGLPGRTAEPLPGQMARSSPDPHPGRGPAAVGRVSADQAEFDIAWYLLHHGHLPWHAAHLDATRQRSLLHRVCLAQGERLARAVVSSPQRALLEARMAAQWPHDVPWPWVGVAAIAHRRPAVSLAANDLQRLPTAAPAGSPSRRRSSVRSWRRVAAHLDTSMRTAWFERLARASGVCDAATLPDLAAAQLLVDAEPGPMASRAVELVVLRLLCSDAWWDLPAGDRLAALLGRLAFGDPRRDRAEVLRRLRELMRHPLLRDATPAAVWQALVQVEVRAAVALADPDAAGSGVAALAERVARGAIVPANPDLSERAPPERQRLERDALLAGNDPQRPSGPAHDAGARAGRQATRQPADAQGTALAGTSAASAERASVGWSPRPAGRTRVERSLYASANLGWPVVADRDARAPAEAHIRTGAPAALRSPASSMPGRGAAGAPPRADPRGVDPPRADPLRPDPPGGKPWREALEPSLQRATLAHAAEAWRSALVFDREWLAGQLLHHGRSARWRRAFAAAIREAPLAEIAALWATDDSRADALQLAQLATRTGPWRRSQAEVPASTRQRLREWVLSYLLVGRAAGFDLAEAVASLVARQADLAGMSVSAAASAVVDAMARGPSADAAGSRVQQALVGLISAPHPRALAAPRSGRGQSRRRHPPVFSSLSPRGEASARLAFLAAGDGDRRAMLHRLRPREAPALLHLLDLVWHIEAEVDQRVTDHAGDWRFVWREWVEEDRPFDLPGFIERWRVADPQPGSGAPARRPGVAGGDGTAGTAATAAAPGPMRDWIALRGRFEAPPETVSALDRAVLAQIAQALPGPATASVTAPTPAVASDPHGPASPWVAPMATAGLARSSWDGAQGPAETEPLAESTLIVPDAGLVLACNFLPRLFRQLDLLEGRVLRDEHAACRAVHLLRYMGHGGHEAPEPSLMLDKLLCGLELHTPVPRAMALSDVDRATVDSLLEALIQHWGALGRTSVDGLREGFLRREGLLARGEDGWTLVVQARAIDVLLDRLPWGIGTLKSPWMAEALHVQWR